MSSEVNLHELYIEAGRYVVALADGSRSCADSFAGGHHTQGLELLVQIIDGLDWLITAVQATKALQPQPVDTAPASGVFREMMEALENQDFPLCGELLEYELIPLLEGWKGVLHGEAGELQ